jgi:hypothetical protein
VHPFQNVGIQKVRAYDFMDGGELRLLPSIRMIQRGRTRISPEIDKHPYVPNGKRPKFKHPFSNG